MNLFLQKPKKNQNLHDLHGVDHLKDIGISIDALTFVDTCAHHNWRTTISLKLRRARMKWFGHVEKMGEERQVKKVLRVEIRGRKPRGRARTGWVGLIKRDLKTSELSLEGAAPEAWDRYGWRP